MSTVESGFIPQFHNAANAGTISGGFGYIAGTLLPKSDILIFSDMDHVDSKSIYADLFSQQKLEMYAKAGVTDIYVETLEIHQAAIDNIASIKDVDKFYNNLQSIDEAGQCLFLSEYDCAEMNRDLADAVAAGAKMNPPIKFHAVQIANTSEQDSAIAQLDEQAQNIGYEKVQAIADKFAEESRKAGVDWSDEDSAFMLGVVSRFQVSRSSMRTIDLIDKGLINFNGLMESHFQSGWFQDRVPSEIIDKFAKQFSDLNKEQNQLFSDAHELVKKYRIDNDVILADRIAETRNPQGRAIVAHGVGHGASVQDDLDEHLQKRGLTVSRVNIFYDSEDLNKHRFDQSDLNYNPVADEITFTDYNGNGRVDGTVHDIKPFRPPVIGNPTVSGQSS